MAKWEFASLTAIDPGTRRAKIEVAYWRSSGVQFQRTDIPRGVGWQEAVAVALGAMGESGWEIYQIGHPGNTPVAGVNYELAFNTFLLKRQV